MSLQRKEFPETISAENLIDGEYDSLPDSLILLLKTFPLIEH